LAATASVAEVARVTTPVLIVAMSGGTVATPSPETRITRSGWFVSAPPMSVASKTVNAGRETELIAGLHLWAHTASVWKPDVARIAPFRLGLRPEIKY
jgi:hypothetical protein